MFVSGLGTAVPARRFTQAECWQALQNSPQFSQFDTRACAVLEKVLCGDNGIKSRHLAVENLAEMFDITPDVLQARFTRHAPALATQAAQRALAEAHLTADDIDAVIISTCTGYLCPGLTSYVSEQLCLRPDVQALDLVGQGCGAALPNWRTSAALLNSGSAKHVLSICVEVCSAAFYLDNDPGVLISACLFGDGAGAAVLSAQPSPHSRRIEWTTAGSLHSPADRDYLRFEHRDGMLRNILTRQVPALAAKYAETLLVDTLARASVKRSEITAWILHAGGREILSALRKRMNLTEADTQLSANILREFGNVSSPCVFFVLAQSIADSKPGGWWWMSSFGAGFSCHGALLKVD